ncbi:MAG: M23 family metallopeptidase [Pseudomonadota bacterium]
MSTGPVAKFGRLLARVFHERQIYHRSDGVVHFISMSSRTQILFALLALGGLLWVAYSSVNVVFKEHILVAQERESREMETAYVRRISEAQRAYDEVNSLNLIMREEFDANMRELNGRHQALQTVVQQKDRLDARFDEMSTAISGNPASQDASSGSNRIMIDSIGREPTPRSSRSPKLRQSAMANQLSTAALALAGRRVGDDTLPADYIRDAVRSLRSRQVALLIELEEQTQKRISELRAILAATGLPTSLVLANSQIETGAFAQGGPFIGLADAERLVLGDNATWRSTERHGFFRQSYRVASQLDRLTELEHAIGSIPMALPITVSHRVSSLFGPRIDPYTKKRAFHGGIDFAGPFRSPVLATAPGRVVHAGTKPAYGRVVEIDHGNGFRTRFGHLHKISVKKGAMVQLHQQVGELGSSGRSTGPHLHYEVWFNGKVRDPQRFFEAGRYVFKG